MPRYLVTEDCGVRCGFFSETTVWWFISVAMIVFGGCASGPPRDGTGHAPVEEAIPAGMPDGVQSSSSGRRQPRRHPSAPPDSAMPVAGGEIAARAADIASSMVGISYRYGGVSPRTGFDCSGLIQYSFRRAGVTLPRTTDDQREVSRLVRGPNLQRGDLLFFDQQGGKNSHAGLYVGNGYFVHAPSSGKRVRKDRLDSAYWARHLSEVRRLELTAVTARGE